MKEQFVILPSAIIAGICISIGCVVNLRVGGVAGAVLFSFGLLAVVHYKLNSIPARRALSVQRGIG